MHLSNKQKKTILVIIGIWGGGRLKMDSEHYCCGILADTLIFYKNHWFLIVVIYGEKIKNHL